MTRAHDKWFSLRTDFYGRDSYQLGFATLTPQAAALYTASVAWACRWGTDEAQRHLANYVGIKRPTRFVTELVEHNLWVPLLDNRFGVNHEGDLWRRGTPLQRRSIPVATRAAVMERDNYQCVECESPDELTLDHIWPYSKGGEDTLENLRVLCRSCNSAKGARI